MSKDIKGSDRDCDDINTSTRQKKDRGNTKLKDLTLRQCTTAQKVQVELDEEGRPIDIERAKFISYIGLLAQSQVSIVFSNWYSVPEATKNKIWEDILLTHDIPSTSKMKQQLLMQVCDQWKDFKSTLTQDYIGGNKKGESPCSQYPFIDEDTWKQFVKSQENPKLQPKNVYKHYLSRGGYKMEKKIIEADSKVMEEVAKLDHNIVIQSPTCPTHQRKWRGARIKKCEAVVAVAEKIKEREETIAEVLRIQNDMLAEVKWMISSMSIGQVPETPSQDSPMVQSDKSSNNLLAKSPSVDIDPSRTPEEGVPYILHLEVPIERSVTNNRMYTLVSKTHHQQIQNGQGDVAIPFPIDKVVADSQ
ncbi:hypothetical protein K1719_016871 [Acacia pycnantha]|nr:hypothetical protein K1719_016871 [Acacia pycnantha]